jgi:hypothetical protein
VPKALRPSSETAESIQKPCGLSICCHLLQKKVTR